MGSDASREGIGDEVAAALGAKPTEVVWPAYKQSCFVYGHAPACASFPEHYVRLQRERAAAGGEAQLKAQCEYWARFDKVAQVKA